MAGQKHPPSKLTTSQTDEEKENIAVVKEYMRISYSPTENHGRESVQHLCTPDSVFIAPTTFPESHTPLDYADSHAKVMSAIADLHIVSFDVVFAKGPHVLLRYSAEGSHCGKPHNGIEPTGRKAHWTAAAIFEVRDGKVYSFTKEWDKLHMWKQLGWMSGDEYV
ncbi:NTF2-like protein [Xylona heveae TC161]|uniref:NTF2-like protein n=1 Tax=Xylona heveae (strain CBS 132557 / TC161) TaxID=1328760 RepID=A0A165H0L1_XYLHT|nr:NTF2-like protein [Xylona heveae TC161]KZF22837.1 NTF2-like protein [Xylona heveae TC161]